MPGVDKNTLQKVFEEYYSQAIQEFRVIKDQRVYYCRTDDQQYILKIFEDEKNLRWQKYALSQLHEKNVRGLLPYISNKHGDIVTPLSDHYVIGVTPYIEGQALDSKNKGQLIHCLKLLSQFHHKGIGIKGKEQVIPYQSHWVDKWKNRLSFFEKSIQQLEAGPYQEGVIYHVLYHASNTVIINGTLIATSCNT